MHPQDVIKANELREEQIDNTLIINSVKNSKNFILHY